MRKLFFCLVVLAAVLVPGCTYRKSAPPPLIYQGAGVIPSDAADSGVRTIRSFGVARSLPASYKRPPIGWNPRRGSYPQGK